MSVRRSSNTGYGLSEALPDIPLMPIVSQRAPTTNDKAAVGTIWVFRPQNLAYVLTSVVNNIATWVDISDNSTDFVEYTVSTADATPTALASFALAASSMITIEGTVSGHRTDFAAALTCFFSGGARRGAAGVPVMIGAPLTIVSEDSASAPDVNIIIVGNSMVLTVTGVAAENWNWQSLLVSNPLP